MTRARLLVSLPEGAWTGDVSRRRPDATIRIHASVLDDDVGFELVSVSGADVDEWVSEIETHASVAEAWPLDRTEEEVTLQVETTRSPILEAATETGLPVEYPIEISDGRATVDATGSHDRLSKLGDSLREAGLRFEVERVSREHETRQLLTEKQRELLFTAVERGYYETPRRCTLTELADHVGLAKSTCSETLHRAEEAVVEYFVRTASTPTASTDGTRRPEASLT